MYSEKFKMKAVKGTPKHLSNTGELNSFSYLMINLEFECNYRCRKCFNQGEELNTISKKPLSLEERLDLIRQAKEIGGKVVVFAGEGEPSMHKDIRSLTAGSSRLGLIPIVYTNASLIDEEFAEFYRANDAVLVISLDSLNKDRYDMMTGTKNQLSKVLRNISVIRDIYRKTITSSKSMNILSLALNATVCGVNHDEIGKIKEFCGDDIYFICNPLAKLGNASPNWSILMPNSKESDDYSKLISEMSESGGPLTLGSDGICGYSRRGIAVSPTGDYMTCAYTHKTNGLLFNCIEKPLKDAFQYKRDLESAHHTKFGPSPCLIRSPYFEEYLRGLGSQKGFSLCYGNKVIIR